MQTITLSNTAHTISIAKLAVGHGKMDDFAKWYLDAYLDAGGNCIDTARSYDGGHAEKAVGNYIKGKQRDRIILVTKCARQDLTVKNSPGRLAPEEIRSDVNTSLSELGVDYIDILFLHRDDVFRPVEEIMPTLHEFIKAGKIRMIGASNWTAGRIQGNLAARWRGMSC